VKFTKPVGLKFQDPDFNRLRGRADRDGKRLGEWCRDRVLEALNGIPPSPAQYAILAEIVATQDIVVGLICALGREGRLSSQKAQEIVDAAHQRKYRDVAALFKFAESKSRKAS
jgi:hypothetical protein